jgi:hypothetical protein
MKPGFFISMAVLLLFSCSPLKHASKTSAKLEKVSTDSTEYEIRIIDNNFDLWYNLNYSPAADHPNEYYRAKNIIGVSNWNYFYTSGKYRDLIDFLIDYRPEIDYGLDVNRKLYWYFRFIITSYKVPLFNDPPVH